MCEIRVYTSGNMDNLFSDIISGSVIMPWRNENEIDYAVEYPENGKHPKAQIEWAKQFLKRFEGEDSSIAEIFTNSPFIIEALDIYGKINGLKVRVFNVVIDDIGGGVVFEEGKSNALKSMLDIIDELEFLDYKYSKKD